MLDNAVVEYFAALHLDVEWPELSKPRNRSRRKTAETALARRSGDGLVKRILQKRGVVLRFSYSIGVDDTYVRRDSPAILL